MASKITSLNTVYSTVHSGSDKKTPKLRYTGPSEPHEVTRKIFPIDDVILQYAQVKLCYVLFNGIS